LITLIMVCLITLALVLAELKPARRGDRKTFLVYAFLSAGAFVLWVFAALNVRVPGPSQPIRDALAAILGVR
jgi:hypothetical protein